MPEIPYLFPAPRGSAGKAAEFSDVLDVDKPEDVALPSPSLPRRTRHLFEGPLCALMAAESTVCSAFFHFLIKRNKGKDSNYSYL
jgi:hypothetical protein